MSTFLRKTCTAATAIVLAVSASACGDDDDGGGSDDPEIEALIDNLAETLGVDRDDAECFANSLIDSIGEDDLRAFNETDGEPTAEQAEAILAAFDECNIPLIPDE